MKSKIIPSVLLMAGFLVGASALSALAAWTPAPNTPPTCPDTTPGCNPPINTGADIGGFPQVKLGTLVLNSNLAGAYGLKVFNGIMLRDASFDNSGNPAGMVLTADATGVGTWKTPSSGKIVNVKYFTKTIGQLVSPNTTVDAMSFSYTPVSPSNILQVDAVVNTQSGSDAVPLIKLYKASTLIAQVSAGDNVSDGDGAWRGSTFLRTFITAGSGPFNFTVQVTNPLGGGNVHVNQADPTNRVSSITVTEITP